MGIISDTDWIYGNTGNKCHTHSPKKSTSQTYVSNAISSQMALDKETETNMNGRTKR